MKTKLLPALFTLALANLSFAQTCREVVRDSSGRLVQTIERHKEAGGTERAVIRDSSGRLIGTATTRTGFGTSGTARTDFRDSSGRLTGTATTQPIYLVLPPPSHCLYVSSAYICH